ncbi:M81 family metallopeptidase [Catenulispora pinisilvae]|uniref:M81 family metallopeptidase n=1 Tax=Catenulispora pinisilvae TaxID=2705253 RepID=UPI0018919B42|nr:M81 family metallopeptidase [Catenulispora pinisilvae]
MRIGIGGIWHETNSFVPEPTGLAQFRAYQYFAGAELVDALRGTGTELGGALEAVPRAVPLFFGAALPSGPVRRDAFEAMLRDLAVRTRAALPLDGLVLSLHGAMMADGHPDPEAEIVGTLRAIVGPVPIAVTLDYHANPGPALAEAADFLVGYRTYPHSDMAERGAEAAELVLRNPPVAHSLLRLPLLTPPATQEHRAEPMRSILAAADRLRAEPGVWAVSALPGFAYADCDRLGFAVYVAAEARAAERARALAAEVWSRRAAFTAELTDPDDAVREALRERSKGPGSGADSRSGPVVLVDVADNVGGGAPGDGTAVLHALARQGATDAVAVLWDPAAVAAAHASPGERLELRIGGHSADLMGPPITVRGRVDRRGPVTYARTGAYMRGQQVDMGRVAVVETGFGKAVLTENRVAPFDDDHLRAVGIVPEEAAFLVAKGAIAWKSGFGGYARKAVYVGTPGYCPADLARLPYRSRPAPMHPLESVGRDDLPFPLSLPLVEDGH